MNDNNLFFSTPLFQFVDAFEADKIERMTPTQMEEIDCAIRHLLTDALRSAGNDTIYNS
jgi:hypothetical protein